MSAVTLLEHVLVTVPGGFERFVARVTKRIASEPPPDDENRPTDPPPRALDTERSPPPSFR